MHHEHDGERSARPWVGNPSGVGAVVAAPAAMPGREPAARGRGNIAAAIVPPNTYQYSDTII